MNTPAAEPEPSPSTGSTSAVTAITDLSASEPTTSGASLYSFMQSPTQPDQDMSSEEHSRIVSQDTTPSRNGLDRDSSTPRAGSPIAMEIDNDDPGVVEIPPSLASGWRIPASYRDLPANHYFIAPPATFPHPRSPVRRFPEEHSLYTQPSLFGHLPRAPPRSPRLDPLEILELESARERNEWEQVCNDLGRPRLNRPSTITGPSQPDSATPSVPETQTEVNGHPKKTTPQAPPSEEDYDSDSSDVELRIYNADPMDETQTPSQPGSASDTVPPTPLGAHSPVTQSFTVPNGAGSAARRTIIERLSQGPSTSGAPGSTPEAAADRPGTSPPSSNTTPAKRKIGDVDQVTQESSAKRKSPAPRPASERAGVPPPLRSEVNQAPAHLPSPGVPPTPVTTETTASTQIKAPQPIAVPSNSTPPAARSGNICRFHNRPPGRVCVRKDQCPDLHIGELQKSTPGVSPAPTPAIETSTLSIGVPPTTVAPPVIAPPLSRTPLAGAPPLGKNSSPHPRPSRTPCRFFALPTGCARGASCQFRHGSNEQTSRPPSRQLAPSPIPAIQAPTPAVAPGPMLVHFGPKATLPATAAASVSGPGTSGPSVAPPATVAPFFPASAPTAPLVSAFALTAPFVPAPAPTPSIFAPTPKSALQPVGTKHPLPAKPPPATTSPQTSPKASTSPAKGKKGKGKAAQGTVTGPSSANKPGAPPNTNKNKAGGSPNIQVKIEIEQDAPVRNAKAAKRKASGARPAPQPTRINTGTREIKQEEVTLYDLADDSPQEPSGSSVVLPELTQSQPRSEVPQLQLRTDALQSQPRTEAPQAQPRTDAPQTQAQVQTRPEVVQPQPRLIAPLPARAVHTTTPTTNTALPPLNRPPPPPYRPPPPANANPSPLSQAPPAPTPMPAAPPAPTVPATVVIPPTPARPVTEQSVPKAPSTNTTNSPATDTIKATERAPIANGTSTQAAYAPKPPAPAKKLSIPVPPRSNPPPAPPRPDMSPDSSPPEPRLRGRQASREPQPDSQGLARRMSPVRRDPPRRKSPESGRRSLMTRMDYRSNPSGSSYRPPSRSRSPVRHYSPPPHRRRSPPPPRGRSPSPGRYTDRRSRLRERPIPRAIPPPRPRSLVYSPSPSRSPYRTSRSSSRSVSRSPSRSPRRQRYEPRPPADGYSKGSAYFPAEQNIPRSWESGAGGSRPVQNQGYESSPRGTMVLVDNPVRNPTPPPRNAITAPDDYDSYNHSRTMDISPARGYVGSGLGNRISDYSTPAVNDYSPHTDNSYTLSPPPEQRENLLTRMIAEPDLANRLAPVGSSTRGTPTRTQPASKASKPQQPLANRLGGGESYPNQAGRNDRRAPPPSVRGGKLMSRMTGK